MSGAPATTCEQKQKCPVAVPVAEHPVHHITLTVTDLDASEAWYHDALGRATSVRRAGHGWEQVRMQWSSDW